jgi:thymidylate synthase (FAD)
MSETIPPEPSPQKPEALPRPSVPALDAVLGQAFKVLDDGFVRVVDYMGSDASIVQAARVSYGAGTKLVSEDRGLIRYLMRHAHTTPFEMCELKLHVRVPMDCWRQWIRHRTANVNEYSTRYSLAIDAAQTTSESEWRSQSKDNKQGSGDMLPGELGAELSAEESELLAKARDVYAKRIERGVAREQARKDLPLSTYTEAYWKCDLHNLFHFLWLRMDAHAQSEIRSYASVIGHDIVAKWCPLAWEAFQDYRMHSMSLSRIDAEIIGHLASGRKDAALAFARERGWLEPGKNGVSLKANRERTELEGKLRELGMAAPWL